MLNFRNERLVDAFALPVIPPDDMIQNVRRQPLINEKQSRIDRTRRILIIIILCTLPCYCLGVVSLKILSDQRTQRTLTPTTTLTATATETVIPTGTASLIPSGTPTPTLTSTQTRTHTPVPSDTPQPTATETAIPPTDTPLPSETPTVVIPPTETPTIVPTA